MNGEQVQTPVAAEAAVRPDTLKAEIRSLSTLLLQRYQFARMAGLAFNGGRDMYEVLGYPRVLTTREIRDTYARGGIAGRIVDSLPNAAWRGEMEIVEDKDPHKDTTFEAAWKLVAKQLNVHNVLRRANILSRLGPYSIILLGVSGDTKLDQELPKANNKNKLIFITPFSGSGGPGYTTRGSQTVTTPVVNGNFVDATVVELDEDPTSPRFGLPMYYRLSRVDTTNPAFLQRIHYSRVIHVAENCLDSDIYGASALERVWNLLMDLDKVTGGGAEAFWLRANQGLQLDVDKDMKLSDEEKVALRAQADEYANSISRVMRTRGVTVNTLGSDVANFNSPADAILTQIAGATAIPKRILTGSEMGELASSQDRDNWKDQVSGYQSQQVGPTLVRQFVDRLITYGYLPTPKAGVDAYEVKWPHVQTLTEQEKADLGQKMAATNSSNGSLVFTADEIREKTQGWEPLTPEQIAAAQPPAPEPAALPAAPEMVAAEAFDLTEDEKELLYVLTAAIESGNQEVVRQIVGVDA